MEWFGLEETLKITKFQHLYHRQGPFPPDQVAQSPVHSGLEESDKDEEPQRHQQAGPQIEKQSYLTEEKMENVSAFILLSLHIWDFTPQVFQDPTKEGVPSNYGWISPGPIHPGEKLLGRSMQAH